MTDLPIFFFGVFVTALVAIGVVFAVMEFNQAHAPTKHPNNSQPVAEQPKRSRTP